MKRICGVALAVVWWAAAAPAARADKELDGTTDELYEKIAAAFKKQEVKALGTKARLQQGVADQNLADNPLPGVCKRLLAKMQADGLYDASSELSIVVSAAQDKSNKRQGALAFVLMSGTDRVAEDKVFGFFVKFVGELPRDPDGKKYPDEESLQLAWENEGKKGVPQPAADNKARQTVPNPVLGGTKFKAREDGRFAVEVNVVKAGAGRAAGKRGIAKGTGPGGIEFLDLGDDDQFELVIHNEAKITAVVRVEIDGIDVFNAVKKADAPKIGGFVIPRETGDDPVHILGWRKTSNDWNRFKVSSYSDSVAAELFQGSPPPALGVIHLTFYHAWPEGESRPAVGGGFNEDKGIGQGDPAKMETKLVNLKVHKQPLASIPLRYRAPAAK